MYGIRPWEMDDLTPNEVAKMRRHLDDMRRREEEV